MNSIFFIDNSLGQLIIWLLWLLLGGSIVFVTLRVLQVLNVELPNLKKAKANIIFFGKKNTLDSKYQQVTANLENSLVKNRIQAMYNIAKRRQFIDYQALLTTTQQSQKANIGNFILHKLPTVCLVMGGLGVLFGLGLTAKQLFYFLSNQSTSEPFTDNLYQVFAVGFWGLTTYGLIHLVISPLRFLNQQLTENLNYFTLHQLMPIFNPLPYNTQFADLINEVSVNTAVLNNISGGLNTTSEQINRDYEMLTLFSSNLKQSIEAFINTQDSLQLLTKTIAEDNQMAENQKILEALNRHNETLAAINERLYQSEYNISDWLKEILTQNEQQHHRFKEQLKGTLDLTRSNLSNTQSATLRFARTIEKFEASLAKMQDNLQNFNEAIDNSMQKEVIQLVEVRKQVAAMHSMLSNMEVSVPQHLAQMSAAMHTTNQLANPKYVQQMAETIAKDTVNKSVAEYKNKIKELEAALAKAKKAHKVEEDENILSRTLKKIIPYKEEEDI